MLLKTEQNMGKPWNNESVEKWWACGRHVRQKELAPIRSEREGAPHDARGHTVDTQVVNRSCVRRPDTSSSVAFPGQTRAGFHPKSHKKSNPRRYHVGRSRRVHNVCKPNAGSVPEGAELEKRGDVDGRPLTPKRTPPRRNQSKD